MSDSSSARVREPRIIIVGAGMSGICLGVTLKAAGFDNFTIYEKADSVGGTWRDNVYPGLTCDVPSYLYQYRFNLNPSWRTLFSSGPDIREYFNKSARDFGLGPHLRFGLEVTEARHDGHNWKVTTADGSLAVADFVVFATGVLHHPAMPDISGQNDFSGEVFHSARWDERVQIAGKRVAVVGSGSTGVQIVSALAGLAEHTTMFQRTPQWVLRIPNLTQLGLVRAILARSERMSQLFYNLTMAAFSIMSTATVRPSIQRRVIQALCRSNLRRVDDPVLREMLTPDYQPLCKRLVMHPNFYHQVQRDDVEIVSEGIDRIESRGVVTLDGRLHEFDVIVLATGFKSHAYLRPVNVFSDGHSLDEAWASGPRAYRSVAVPGFPNFFMIMGPNSPVGNFSLVPIAEAQSHYIVEWIEKWSRGHFDTASPTQGAADSYADFLRQGMPNTVWVTGCDSWYLGADGLPELWPFSPHDYMKLLGKADGMNFEFDKGAPHV